jgi:putative aldouronate transport system substrate-binding protein
MKDKRIAITLSLFLVSAMSVFCGGNSQQSPQSTGLGGDKITLTGFSNFWPSLTNNINSYNDLLAWKVIDEKYGIHVEWQNVTSDWETQLSLVIASRAMPDVFFRITPQLAEQYGYQGALISLNDLIDTKIPNLKSIMNENKAVRGQVTSADGKIYFFPRLLLDPRTQHYPGLMIREDWLQALGLPVPQTVDDFYNVLKAIKEADFNKDGNKNEAPFMGDYKFLIWAFGVGSRGPNQQNDFFVENGQIKYGPTDPRYRTALEYINKLYTEGLIETTPSSGDTLTQKIIGESVGSTYGSWMGYLSSFNKLLALEGKNPGLRGVAPLQGPTGERNALSHHTEIDLSCGGAISSTSKKADDVAHLMDIIYSREGQLLFSFGVEGDTYTMVNGVPVYTDKVTKHPTLAVGDYLSTFISPASMIPNICIPEQYLASLSPEGIDGNRMTAAADVLNKKPPSLRFSDAELAEVQILQRDIDTYVDENRDKFINGQQPFSQWNTFQAGLQQMNISRLVTLYNNAYQRFLAASK